MSAAASPAELAALRGATEQEFTFGAADFERVRDRRGTRQRS